MKSWFDRLLWKTDTRALELRISEAIREIAVLWLTFSLLDEVIAERLTVRWVLTNAAACIAFWTVGTYIELRNGRGE